jgi:phosphoribosylformylglycinamidine synthase
MFIFIKESPSREYCYQLKLNIIRDIPISDLSKIVSLLRNNDDLQYSSVSFLSEDAITVGPIGHFKTSEEEIMVEVLRKCHVNTVDEITKFTRSTEYIDYDALQERVYDFKDLKRRLLKPIPIYKVKSISNENEEQSLGLDTELIHYYETIFKDSGINNLELFDLAQGNSEHSRHWIFNGHYIIDGVEDEESLFQKIKSTNDLENSDLSLIAFSDNASAIRGFNESILISKKNVYNKYTKNVALTSNAETHNFPTGICPFPGAATGAGGRIRDTVSIGKGGMFLSGFIGYYVGDLKGGLHEYPYKTPMEILIEASNGASDYGNKIGEPLIGGFTRSFGMGHYEYIKPVLYSAGNGYIYNEHLLKEIPVEGLIVVRIGGGAYKIGLGGGSCSSRSQDTKNNEADFNAVQRGNPEMENRVCRFIRTCAEMGDANPIKTIHDQGSGGMANVTKELVSPVGADISLDNVILGDSALGPFEIWNAEYQEQCSFLINEKDKDTCRKIAERENVPIAFIGKTRNDGVIHVVYKDIEIVTFNLKDVLEPDVLPIKKIKVNSESNSECIYDFKYGDEETLECGNVFETLMKVLNDPAVGSKRYLVHKVDRSVTGLVAKQQCTGPWNTPLNDYSINAMSYESNKGIATSFGERPIIGLFDIEAMISMSVGEMLTNLIFSGVNFEDIKCQVNWMWSAKLKGHDYLLHLAVSRLRTLLKELDIGIDGGKDSLSMNCQVKGETIISPNSTIIKSYAPLNNIYDSIEPYFKAPGNNIIFIDLGNTVKRLGGSIYNTLTKVNGLTCPTFNHKNIKRLYSFIHNRLHNERDIVSGHDISDGGFITTLIEMSISSFYGFDVSIHNINNNVNDFLFSEELGIILETSVHSTIIEDIAREIPELVAYKIGNVVDCDSIKLVYNDNCVLETNINVMKMCFEKISYNMELQQSNEESAVSELFSIEHRAKYEYNIPFSMGYLEHVKFSTKFNNVCILRETGSNSDREMAAAFNMSGFTVFEYTTQDIIRTPKLLQQFNGIAFVGGFSYSDTFSSGYAWYHTLKSNKTVMAYLTDFYHYKNSFSLGVCNGCQLMSHLEWIPKCKVIKNDSEKFESRFSNVIVKKSNCMFTKGMDNTFFGINVSHGEGKIVLDKSVHVSDILDQCAPIRYANDYREPTEMYPFNPNGSKYGIAGLCSKNGRHLAMMPHPERSFLKYQCQYISENYKHLKKYSPWFQLFNNITY